jgi:hypothetical protein
MTRPAASDLDRWFSSDPIASAILHRTRDRRAEQSRALERISKPTHIDEQMKEAWFRFCDLVTNDALLPPKNVQFKLIECNCTSSQPSNAACCTREPERTESKPRWLGTTESMLSAYRQLDSSTV